MVGELLNKTQQNKTIPASKGLKASSRDKNRPSLSSNHSELWRSLETDCGGREVRGSANALLCCSRSCSKCLQLESTLHENAASGTNEDAWMYHIAHLVERKLMLECGEIKAVES